MDIEKFNEVVDYFSANGIPMAVEVINSIQDAFEENDNIDSVECYFKEDAHTFATDITFSKKMIVNINGKSTGENVDVYSYYGDPEFVLNEKMELVDDNGSVLSSVSDISYDEKTSFNENDYVVILIEKHKWETPDFSTEKALLIYCPEDAPNE